MIRLLYAHHPELLAQGLAQRLEREPDAERDLLHPFEIVVPNRNLKVWLTYELTRRLGAVGHLRFRFLSEFLTGAVSVETPVPPLMNQDTLMLRLLELVDSPEVLANPLLQPVSRYVHPPEADERERELRRLQFVETMAGLFLEYEFSRPRMCEAWSRHELTTRQPLHRALETWQAELWRLLNQPRHPAPGVELPPLKPLSHRFRHLSAERVTSRSPVHLFAFSYMARGYVECLHQLSEFRPIFLYTINPCREYWEDVETPKEQRRRRSFSVPRVGGSLLEEPSEDPFGLRVDMENPLLQMWGKPGRENIRFLNEAVDCDFESVYPDDCDSPEPCSAACRKTSFGVWHLHPRRMSHRPSQRTAACSC
ncbi:MAG TPA: exodeoxyribonuclease V subunit gamma [Candidatus Ozemobacteraceae bacterium]|nr:exodeoxyribonuclease V subunit gamma [Candidatus Ozemobacteraceae bacterium]